AAAGLARMARALDVNPDAEYMAPVVLRTLARPDLAGNPGGSRVHRPLCIRQDLMREVAVTVPSAGMSGAMSAARPQLIRALNEQLLLGYIRDHGPCSRADLARLSGLSKPTVSLALATVEQAGLVQEAGQRIGRPGRSALLYEIKPEA